MIEIGDFAPLQVQPKWTAYRKAQVIKTYRPWMEFYMLRAIRKIPVQKSWTKYVIDRDWRGRVPKGTPGPPCLHDCIWVCQNLQPGGRFLKKKLLRKLLDC